MSKEGKAEINMCTKTKIVVVLEHRPKVCMYPVFRDKTKAKRLFQQYKLDLCPIQYYNINCIPAYNKNMLL
jgi:hypothetical protein